MNINDDKLHELMSKTKIRLRKKKRTRGIVCASIMGACTIALAVVAFNVFVANKVVLDRTIEDTNNVASQNSPTATQQYTPTPLPDGTTFDPNGGPTPVVIQSFVWEEWSETKDVDGVEITVNIGINTIQPPPSTSVFSYEIELETLDIDFSGKAIDYFLGDNYNNAEDNLKFHNVEYEGNVILETLEVKRMSENQLLFVSLMNRFDADWNSLIYRRGSPDRHYIEAERIYDNDTGYSEKEMGKISAAASIAYETVGYFTDDMECDFTLSGYFYNGGLEANNVLDHIDYDNSEKCYIFYFTKKYNGLYATFDKSPLPYQNIKEVSVPDSFPTRWDNEYIQVVIDELGLAEFCWHNISKTIESTNNNLRIISIEEALKIVKDKSFRNAFNLSRGSKTEINLSEIRFEMVRIKTEDGRHMMVPAYTIKGTQTSIESSGETIIHSQQKDNANILIINALDGSIID
ncbi:MAG: hypothetical protein KAQ68_01050 [Clostridiales bacterium]|nr:hypothetical protein [Clostridiales bacterium]